MMKEKLQNIKEEALKEIEAADMPEKLNDVRVKFLGKKGELTAVLKGMKDVAPEDRPKVGQMVNETRAAIEAVLEENKEKMEKAIRAEKLKKEEIDETKPINRYLFTMLKNDLLNTLRDSKKNIYLLEDCLSMVLELEDNSQNENLKQEQMNIIQQALEQLSPQRRKVFEMKVSGKYSNQEIADKLNLSINTIKFQYSQSLKQIRATVGELSLLLLYCMM